jgi:hypothetical protein
MRTWRRLSELAAVATVAGSLALTGTSAAVADADPRVAGTRINNLATGRCLYDSGNASGGTFTGSCLTGNRYWQGYADDFGNRIVNTSTGRCLTASTSSVWSASCNGATAQQWHVVGAGLFQNVHWGVCMQGTVAGGGVFMASCNQSSTYQQWHQLDVSLTKAPALL